MVLQCPGASAAQILVPKRTHEIVFVKHCSGLAVERLLVYSELVFAVGLEAVQKAMSIETKLSWEAATALPRSAVGSVVAVVLWATGVVALVREDPSQRSLVLSQNSTTSSAAGLMTTKAAEFARQKLELTAWAPLLHSAQASAALLGPQTIYWAASIQMPPELGTVSLLPRSAVGAEKSPEPELVGLCASGRILGDAPRMMRPALALVGDLVP